MRKWLLFGLLGALAWLAIIVLGLQKGLLLSALMAVVVLPVLIMGMRRGIVVSIVACVVLWPICLLSVLLYTRTGLQLISDQMHRLERFGVHIEGLSGTLAGPFRVARFELDHPRVHIVSHDIVIHTHVRSLLLQTLAAESLTARDTLVEIRRASLPPTDRPPRFLPSFLRVDVPNAQFNSLRYVNINGMIVDAQRLHGSVRISPRTLTVRSFRVDAEQFVADGNALLRAQRPLQLELKTRGEMRMPRGESLALNAELGGDIERLLIKASSQRPNVAAVDLVLTRPNDSWRIDGTVRSPRFTFDSWLEKPPLTLSDVALQVSFDPQEIRATGQAGIPEFNLRDLTVDARGRFESRLLRLHAADIGIQRGPGKLHAEGTLQFDGGPPTLDLNLNWRELQWPVRGVPVVTSAVGEGTLRGPLPYDFFLRAQAVGPRIPTAQGTASGSLSKEQLTVTDYRFGTLGGAIAGAGSLQFAQPRAWTLTSQATQVNPGFFNSEFPGTLSFVATGRGVGVNKDALFSASMRNLSGTLRGKPVAGRASVERTSKSWHAREVGLRFGSAQLALDGAWGDVVDAHWSLHADSLTDLLPNARGKVDFTGSLRGALKAPHVVLDLRADNLRYEAWRAQQLVISGDVNFANEDPSRLRITTQRAGRAEPMVETLSIVGNGTPGQHRLEIEAVGATRPGIDSPSRAKVSATGRFVDGVWNAVLTTTHLSNGGSQNIESVEPANVLISRERMSLDNFCLALGAGRMCANGKWQRNGPWEGTVSGYEIPLAATLPQSSADAQYAGRIEGRVHAFGAPGQPWQAEAGARIIDAAIIYSPPGVEPETLQLGTGGLAATARPDKIEFSFGVQAFTDTFLFASARLDRSRGGTLLQLPLVGDMRARAGDANILPLVFPEIDHAAGVLTANANITGTLAAPQIDGRIELANGEFDSYRVNLALRELGVTAEVAGNRLAFKGSGRAGDGRLEADGRFTWTDGKSQGTLRIAGDDLLVADLPEYRVVASPKLTFLVDGERIGVAGDVEIPSARIQPVNLSGVVRTSDDARFVGEHPAEREGRLTVHSEVRVTMGEDVRVDAFGLQGRVTGSVGVTSNTGETAIGRGEMGVAEGRYEAYGQKLDISRGRLLFTASPLDDPALDIEARRKVETVEVGLNVRGTLREPRLSFFSDASLSQSQIASYLLVGKPLDQVHSGDRSAVNSARDSLAFQGGGLLASQLGRRFGIDEVGVESTIGSAGEANQSLVLGKFLSPRLFVSYGISLTESINTLKLRYSISDNWIFKTEAGENQSADVEFTVERR